MSTWNQNRGISYIAQMFQLLWWCPDVTIYIIRIELLLGPGRLCPGVWEPSTRAILRSTSLMLVSMTLLSLTSA
jgi:hypothetical protein